MKLLATKKLSLGLRDRLIQHGFSLVEQPFIQIQPLHFSINFVEDHVLFTSQNAVQIAFSNPELSPLLEKKKYYCVGEKTKSLIEKNGQKVIKMTQNSAELVHFLKKMYKNERFSFFCGKRRRPEVEQFFSENNILHTLHEIYDTVLTPKQLNTHFDGILFFSPSAVDSFFRTNSWEPQTRGFCIGATTASFLHPYTQNYSIAKEPNETQLFLSIHNYYTHHHAQK
jgi:uroporphyrinogen-III synthase